MNGGGLPPAVFLVKKGTYSNVNKSFSFNKFKRSFFTVELKAPEGEDGKKLVVKMPKKKTFEKLNTIGSLAEEDIDVNGAFDVMGGLMAEILSNNITGEKVSMDYITENYDIEEMYTFIDEFMDFVADKKTDPN